MVVSSRSSMRQSTLHGDHDTPLSPTTKDASQSSMPEPSRLKRARVASLSNRSHLYKRRRLSSDLAPEQVQIPLRAKDVTSNTTSNTTTRVLPSHPLLLPSFSSDNSPLGSPSTRPQYDQIRRIEEKARAAIHATENGTTKKDDRRRLRSDHGGSRSKTELSQYFPTFDEMLNLDPPDPDSLTAKTHIILVNDTPDFQPPSPQSDPFGSNKVLHNVTYVDILSHQHSSKKLVHDPLGPEFYYKAHRKAERHEKQMKNGDKERAQHEKYQLERLLDELRGPDWLKTLGITGITDTEKKRYEPKRALFIRETKGLIDKFKRWKEEEKRRKLEKEQAQLDEATEHEDDDDEEDAGAGPPTSMRKGRRKAQGRTRSPSTAALSAKAESESSDIDDLASQQLLQEAKSASALKRKKVLSSSDPNTHPSQSQPHPPLPPEPHKPFTSFFSKRHIRDAAVAGRQRGRTVLAFGLPVPDFGVNDGGGGGAAGIDFELPEEILTEDAIRRSQRGRRRVRRGTIDE